MTRDITVSFDDGSQHVYQGAPDDVTPQQVQERAQKDFGKSVVALDGGRKPQNAAQPPQGAAQPPQDAAQPPQGVDAGAAPPPPQPGMMDFLMGAPRQGQERPSGMAGNALDFLTNRARDVAAFGETAASVGTGMTTGALAGLLAGANRVAQQVTELFQGNTTPSGPSVGDTAEQAAARYTYQPRMPQAQEQVGAIGHAMQEHGPSLIGIGPEIGALGRILSHGAGDAAMLAGDRTAAAVTPKISPQRAVNVKAGMEQGLEFAPHQLAENTYVKKAGETMESVPLSGGGASKEARLDKFHEALAQQINPEAEGVTHITPDVLETAMNRSGGGLGEIYGAHEVPIDDLTSSFAGIRRQLKRASPDDAHIVGGYLDEFERVAQENGGVLPGDNFKALNSELGAKIRANAGNPTGHLLSDLQDNLLDAFRKQLSPEEATSYDAFRAQYAKAKTILPVLAKAPEGRIDPGALMGAINRTKSGQNAMALGYAGELGDLARAGKYLVDSKSSGTAELNLIHRLILDPAKGALKVATVLPAAKLYNKVAPGIARAMVRRGLENAPEGMVPELAPGEAPPPIETPPTGGPQGPAGGPGTPEAPTDPRLAEIAKMREASTDPAVQAALDAHEKTVQTDIKTKAADTKRMASVDALEKAAQATQDPDLRATLQKQADKLRGEKIPVGEAKEVPMPAAKPEKVGKVPVGQAIEGQPNIPVEGTGKIPRGEATEITPETIEPQEPIPVGEATDVSPQSNQPQAEPVSNVPKSEQALTSNRPKGEGEQVLTSNVPKAEEDAYTHRGLYDAADKYGIETRGRRPSEVRAAYEAEWRNRHGLNAEDAARAKKVAIALGVDEEAVQTAATQHERSPRMFDREIDRIIQEGTENAFETHEAANSSEGNPPNPPGPEGGAPGGRGGNANVGTERPASRGAPAGKSAGSVQGTAERAGADGAPAARSDNAGNQPGGQAAEAIPVGEVTEGAPETFAANNASGDSEASSEAINRAAREKAAGQTRMIVEKDGTVRPLIGMNVDEVARPGQVIAQRGIGAKEWTVLSSGSDLTKGAINRALSKLPAGERAPTEGEGVAFAPNPAPRGFEKGAQQMKPRMAESGDDLYAAIKKASGEGVVVPGRGILYPTARVVGLGDFQLSPQGKLERMTGDGRGVRDATKSEIEDFHDALDKDQVQVLVRSKWGGSGGDRATGSRDLEVLHSPSGNSFGHGFEKGAQKPSKPWIVSLVHASGKTKEIQMPGGLHESEATRGALLKAGANWRIRKLTDRKTGT